jgi:hypothetical protein
MVIADTDIKKLWGLSAGQCNYPGCNADCIQFLEKTGAVVIGEMAHIIARKQDGPRGESLMEDNTYNNLILLCPSHHTIIDKAPADFSKETLLKWKEIHESSIRKSLMSIKYDDKLVLFNDVKKMLIKNHSIWLQYGPDSDVAKSNPYSNSYQIWQYRKIDTIIPNNRKIINLIDRNINLLSENEYEVACLFINHAEGFEKSAYKRLDYVPKFPKKFEEMLNGR